MKKNDENLMEVANNDDDEDPELAAAIAMSL